MFNKIIAYTIALASISSLHSANATSTNIDEFVRNSPDNKSLSSYQEKVSNSFKDALVWSYDEDMAYSQLTKTSPEKRVIDFVTDKVASSIAECNGKYYIQTIQGSSLVASDRDAGDIYEITDPSYSGATTSHQTTKADMLNGEEYSGSVTLSINTTAYKSIDSSKWQNGRMFSRGYDIAIIDGHFVDEKPFSEDHLRNLEMYEPLQCSHIPN